MIALSDAEKLLRKELEFIALKSVNEVTREYQDALERYVVNVANGNMTAGEMSRTMRALIKRLAPDAYMEGMKEGGIRDPESEMEDEDDETIAVWMRDQLLYVDDFVAAVYEVAELKGDEKTTARNAMIDRVQDWVDSLQFIGQRGYLSAKGNLSLTFDGDDGDESCETCQRYKGQRHRKSWWEKRGLLDRPNEKFICGRFQHCHHSYYDDDGNIVAD